MTMAVPHDVATAAEPHHQEEEALPRTRSRGRPGCAWRIPSHRCPYGTVAHAHIKYFTNAMTPRTASTATTTPTNPMPYIIVSRSLSAFASLLPGTVTVTAKLQ